MEHGIDTGSQNERWAAQLIEALIAQGVHYFCLGPGSRSTPLALAVARHPKELYSVHFDERGVCFHAVGYAKGKGKPAAVITTSGTATGNLLPGIMEASNERVPLIVLTADRPPELQGCGANQTCDQVKLFTNHIRWQIDLPCPDERIPKRYLASTISHAVAMAQSSPKGPVHINCLFREPLFSKQIEHTPLKEHVTFTHPELHPSKETIEVWAEKLCGLKKGVIIAGSSDTDQSEEIFALAERLQWPLFADILSGPRRAGDHPCLITHCDPILKCKGEVEVDAIIQFGDRLTSKTLQEWLKRQTPAFYLHISHHALRQDPDHLITHRLHTSPALFTEKLLHVLTAQNDQTWQTLWKEWDRCCSHTLTQLFSQETTLTEPGLIPQIASLLSEEWALFLASSMPIRDANQFFAPKMRCGPLFGNRGVSGIDGNIATAAGIARGSGKPTLALLGDLAFLHDLNSLPYLNKIDPPLLLCVVNNGGGGIFSFLPISQRKEPFETLFAASHTLSFASAASLFKIPYFHPQSPEEFKDLLFQQKINPHSCIIEITTDRIQNVAVHEQILTRVQAALSSVELAEETSATSC